MKLKPRKEGQRQLDRRQLDRIVITGTLLGAGVLGLGIAAHIISGSDGRENDQTRMEKASAVLNIGNPAMLKIHASPYGIEFGPETLFYDLDGDKQTVEQVVQLYDVGATFPQHSNVVLDLVRSEDTEPGFDPNNIGGLRREMTLDEADSVDRVYQGLISLLPRP